MASSDRFLVLANSKKSGGHGVALIDPSGHWHRPVSSREHGELSQAECRLSSERRMLRLLDVVEASLGRGVAMAHQPEDRGLPANWVLSAPARHASEIDEWLELAVDHDADFLTRESQDRISETDVAAKPLRSSLALVRPSAVTWIVRTAYGGGRQVRASFTLPNVNDGRDQPIAFDLAVTDSEWKSHVLKVANGTLGSVASARLGIRDDSDVYLTMSLGEPFEGTTTSLLRQ